MHFLIPIRSVLLRIKNGSGKCCRENQNTQFKFNNFLWKIVPYMRKCGKIFYSEARHRWKYGPRPLHAG